MHALLLAAALLLPAAQEAPKPAEPPKPAPAAAPAPAPNPADTPAAGDKAAADKAAPGALPPVEPPPALTPAKASELDRAIKQLRADKVEYRKNMEKQVIAFGRGAIPALAVAATTTHAGQMESIANCLIALADLRDRDFVVECVGSKLPTLRRFAARKAADYDLPEVLDALAPLLKDSDAIARNEAALSLVTCGREQGLDVLVLIFAEQRERVLKALPGVAGKGDHEPVANRLKLDPEREKLEPQVTAKERVAAVQLLHAMGDRDAQRLLVGALDDKHNLVQREAINALRDLLEQKPPLDGTSIFQQINEVKRLKELWSSGK